MSSAAPAAYADLHIHTNYSDGVDAPSAVVERAACQGLQAIAITDHDSVGGLAEGEHAAGEHGIAFLRGVEITAHFGANEVHILGFGIDPHNRRLRETLEDLCRRRRERLESILLKLNEAGITLDRAEVEAHSGRGVVGRMHVAQVLVAKGLVKKEQQAFDKYLRRGRRAYVPSPRVACEEAIALIHEAHGLAFLAHPGINTATHRVASRLLDLPFDGIEVYHSKHTPGHVTEFTQIALQRDLLISGGSDCHGAINGREPEMGRVLLPLYHFERIRKAL